ncbi:MAG TPA: 50S ribosomal protein L30e [Methanothermococcus okinawensis]|uniref:Large ribosomal subunit protein eL30 n=1 Tax=Methanothermococcus okinawensis TaxID=155863 RepID=A0A832ZZH5_9EURY|nr:50S ribosomal protein L30e [Methanothermococcus okinawensis]
MDINKAIRTAVDTGEVVLGSRQAIRSIKHGKGKLVIVAGNCKEDIIEDVKYYAKLSNIPVYIHDVNSLELGAICGKPFPVSVMVILDPGNSDILDMVKSEG